MPAERCTACNGSGCKLDPVSGQAIVSTTCGACGGDAAFAALAALAAETESR